MKKLSAIKSRSQLREIKPSVSVTDDPEFCPGATLHFTDTGNSGIYFQQLNNISYKQWIVDVLSAPVH